MCPLHFQTNVSKLRQHCITSFSVLRDLWTLIHRFRNEYSLHLHDNTVLTLSCISIHLSWSFPHFEVLPTGIQMDLNCYFTIWSSKKCVLSQENVFCTFRALQSVRQRCSSLGCISVHQYYQSHPNYLLDFGLFLPMVPHKYALI